MNAHLLQCSLTPEQYQKITAEIVCKSHSQGVLAGPAHVHNRPLPAVRLPLRGPTGYLQP